jgi:uncharacterized lipoprotein YajG
MRLKSFILISLIVLASACAEMQKVLQATGPAPLTENDVVSGLKEALITGPKTRPAYLVHRTDILVTPL